MGRKGGRGEGRDKTGSGKSPGVGRKGGRGKEVIGGGGWEGEGFGKETDIWGLGVVMFFMLGGYPPFVGKEVFFFFFFFFDFFDFLILILFYFIHSFLSFSFVIFLLLKNAGKRHIFDD